MKIYVLLVIALTIPLFANAKSQGEMDLKSLAEFRKSESRLHLIYAKLRSRLDDAGKTKLKKSEEAWLSYREAQARYEMDVAARGGTMAPTVYNLSRITLTDNRTKELQQSFDFVVKFGGS